MSPLFRPEFEDLLEELDLFQMADGLGAFDAVLAASARRREWAVASAEEVFGTIGDLRYMNPASPTFLIDART